MEENKTTKYKLEFEIANSFRKHNGVDNLIVNYLIENPNAAHNKIAERVYKSQPVIGIKIKTMIKSKVLKKQYTINFNKDLFVFMKVDVETDEPERLINDLFLYPNVLEIFNLSGEYNVSLIIVGKDCKDVNNFSEKHVIKNVKKYKQEFITNRIAKPISYD